MTFSFKEHWNKKYADTPVTQLGWYEARSLPSLALIENCVVQKDSAIMDVGSGASILIANLLDLGYRNIIAVDISSVALEKAKEQLGEERAALLLARREGFPLLPKLVQRIIFGEAGGQEFLGKFIFWTAFALCQC